MATMQVFGAIPTIEVMSTGTNFQFQIVTLLEPQKESDSNQPHC